MAIQPCPALYFANVCCMGRARFLCTNKPLGSQRGLCILQSFVIYVYLYDYNICNYIYIFIILYSIYIIYIIYMRYILYI